MLYADFFDDKAVRDGTSNMNIAGGEWQWSHCTRFKLEWSAELPKLLGRKFLLISLRSL